MLRPAHAPPLDRQGRSGLAQRALTPQKTGFLAGAFSHTLNPYAGCTFGRTGCPFCYVRESPMGRFGPDAWGYWVRPKTNIAEVLTRELRKDVAQHYTVFMASATDPYQPLEARAALTQRCLQVMQEHPVAWLVVQTRSLLVARDFDLLAQLPFVTLNVSLETDLLAVQRRITPSSPAPERRLALVRAALDRGIHTQVTVAPLLPSSPDFAERLCHTVGHRGRIIIDTFVDGDGSGGRRSTRLGMGEVLTAAGFPGWFAHCREHAQQLQADLHSRLQPEQILWSAAGFGTRPAGS